MSVKNLTEIIKQCQRNNSKAQKTLYQKFSPWLFGVCLQYCKDRTDAEDNLQDGFIKIFTNIDKFRFEGSFEGWMRRIMVNTIIESFRKKNPVYLVDSMETYQIEDEESTDDVPLHSSRELLQIIESLPPKYKLVFNLYALEGLSHQEISEMLDISVGTSKSNLSRARKILKQKLSLKKDSKTQTA
ncbi:RNA polymerase sigma-70 factor, ECF subfamily [Saccharicrinis carchari]|uniref:RNA polymerase sigma-70 factor, ECF subfamily n=1 Tax=Saccharicrinis carchari TaxID=1168039 RepID=A0A521DMX4_SACCC|nr:sigma-70 family RNA polymerase sigma factor [Saccharicrinis carchari]SMO73046.1 RNA polymerase sigma-70 factor, ECF subfamily [Saccharicrinis carchari]